MSKLNSEATALFNETGIWLLATYGDKPNAAPIAFKKIDENGNMVLFDVFMKKTVENLSKNSSVAISAYNDKTLQGYQVKGTAVYSTDKALLAEGDAAAAPLGLKTKGAVIVTVQEVYIQTPGPDVGKLI